MNQENLAYRSSFIHGLNPAVRIVCAVLFSIPAALAADMKILAAYFVLSVLSVFSARIRVSEALARLKPLFIFLVMIWVVLPVTFEGDAVFSFSGLDVTRQGIHYCLLITVKSTAIVLFFIAFVVTMTVPAMGHALQKLRLSDKLVFLILMTYRYISVIQEEYRRLFRAARVRGFVPGTNIHSYRTYAFFTGMLFVRASMRARRVHQAMICRGFSGKFHTVDKMSFDKVSMIFLAGVIIVVMTLVFLQIAWVRI